MEATGIIEHFSKTTKGWTLPVWVVASAKAATEVLLGKTFNSKQIIVTSNNEKNLIVAVTSAALIENGQKAIGIAHCDSGLGLDITRGMEIWTCVQLKPDLLKQTESNDEQLLSSSFKVVAGFGVGKSTKTGEPCLSAFAYELLDINLRSIIPNGFFLQLEVVFPLGKELAERTSNSAFGVVDGLSIIGTQAEAQISASPEQLQNTINELRQRCLDSNFSGQLIFVIGENGFDLALKFGFLPISILKVGNWLGPLIVAAAESGVKKLLVFGYHGKLIKLAGGIFHTHNHLADGRLEILIFLAVNEGLPLDLIQFLSKASSVEEALLILEAKDSELVKKLWFRVATEIEKSSVTYVNRYVSSSMEIGSALFDRQRSLRWYGQYGFKQLDNLGVTLQS